MPRLDGTGPLGKGPFTGRGMGYCTGYVNPPFNSGYMPGRGVGRGRGFGRGFGSQPGPGLGIGRGGLPRGLAAKGIMYNSPASYSPLTKEEELAALNNNKKEINTQLSGIEKRIKELRK